MRKPSSFDCAPAAADVSEGSESASAAASAALWSGTGTGPEAGELGELALVAGFAESLMLEVAKLPAAPTDTAPSDDAGVVWLPEDDPSTAGSSGRAR